MAIYGNCYYLTICSSRNSQWCKETTHKLGVSITGGTQIAGWFIMENPIQSGWFRATRMWKHPKLHPETGWTISPTPAAPRRPGRKDEVPEHGHGSGQVVTGLSTRNERPSLEPEISDRPVSQRNRSYTKDVLFWDGKEWDLEVYPEFTKPIWSLKERASSSIGHSIESTNMWNPTCSWPIFKRAPWVFDGFLHCILWTIVDS